MFFFYILHDYSRCCPLLSQHYFRLIQSKNRLIWNTLRNGIEKKSFLCYCWMHQFCGYKKCWFPFLPVCWQRNLYFITNNRQQFRNVFLLILGFLKMNRSTRSGWKILLSIKNYEMWLVILPYVHCIFHPAALPMKINLHQMRRLQFFRLEICMSND